MPTIAAKTVLASAQKGMRTEVVRMMTDVSTRAAVRLQMAAVNGVIPLTSLTTVQREIGDILQRVFVGADGRSAFSADGVSPLSPFAAALNKWTVWTTAKVVLAHHDWLRQHAPPDVFRWLLTPQPLASEFSNPFTWFKSLFGWVDPSGYVLSDRIWQNAVRTRLKVDAFIAARVRRGQNAFDMARDLERFLRPDRRHFRTSTPYGVDASFDAMRLARTEITAHFGRVTIAAARANPYVTGIRWNLSPSHPRADICDSLASNSPYPVDNVPSYPAHPHCLCNLTSEVRNIAEVTEELRQMIANGDVPEFETPADYDAFLLRLLGGILYELAKQMEAA